MSAQQHLLVSQRGKHGVMEHVESGAPESKELATHTNDQRRSAHVHSLTGSKFKLCLVHVTQILFRTCTLIQIKSIFLLHRYKVSFIATDETYNLEFMFLEKREAELTGKIGDALRKQYKPI